jgi:hypothetical protein
MSAEVESILRGTTGLDVIALAALIATVLRYSISSDQLERKRFAVLFLIGVGLQCIHFMEELQTGFYVRFPALLGQTAWPATFFAAFNVCWIALWLISAAGLVTGFRAALFPIWFFIFATVLNGVAHPILAALSGRYFPGLATSPIVGIMGVWLWYRLARLTRRPGVARSTMPQAADRTRVAGERRGRKGR